MIITQLGLVLITSLVGVLLRDKNLKMCGSMILISIFFLCLRKEFIEFIEGIALSRV